MPLSSIRHYFAIFSILSAFGIATGTHKCVWVRGALQCQRDPTKQLNVVSRLIAFWVNFWINSRKCAFMTEMGSAFSRHLTPTTWWGIVGHSQDALWQIQSIFSVTFTEADGTFQLDGCGDDFNWLPGLQNLPDPYIRIHHYCNSEHGETFELPEFDTFVVTIPFNKKKINFNLYFRSAWNVRFGNHCVGFQKATKCLHCLPFPNKPSSSHWKWQNSTQKRWRSPIK